MRRIRSRKGAPGIVDVAQRAGVSPATVSRCFNAPDVVKSTTRKRIEEAASDLGYIRDRMAGTLHNRFSGTVGLVVPTIDNAIFAELIGAFAAKLRQLDRTLLISAHGFDLSLETDIIRSLLERRIDGVALIGLDHERTPLEMLATRGVPVLAVWNYRPDSELPCVGANNHAAGVRVAEYLIDKGHRDIGLMFPPVSDNDRAQDRLNGARHALEQVVGPVAANRFVETPYDIGTAKQCAIDLLRDNPPTAIICGNDIIAQGAVFACQALGLSVPTDISIIGIGDFRGSAFMEPALTTLRMPARTIGEIAAEKLCHGVSSTPGREPERVLVPATLLERGSVGICSDAAAM